MKRGKPPNAVEKKWLELVAGTHPGSVVHHPVGSTAKHNKIEIGNWWIIPMRDWDHRALHNQAATFGYESRKAFEKARFSDLFDHPAIQAREDLWPPEEAIKAIREYHK